MIHHYINNDIQLWWNYYKMKDGFKEWLELWYVKNDLTKTLLIILFLRNVKCAKLFIGLWMCRVQICQNPTRFAKSSWNNWSGLWFGSFRILPKMGWTIIHTLLGATYPGNTFMNYDYFSTFLKIFSYVFIFILLITDTSRINTDARRCFCVW